MTQDRGDSSLHNRVARAEPNDHYDGPILAGQRWQSRGTGKHGRQLYTVLRFNGRSVQVVAEGSRHDGGRRFNVPEASWRGNFNLVKQAPGYDPSAPNMLPPAPAPVTVDEAVHEVLVGRKVGAFNATQETTDKPLWPISPVVHVHSAVEVALDPPTPEGMIEQIAVLEAIRKEKPPMIPVERPLTHSVAVPPTEPETPRAEPVTVGGEVVDYTVPLPSHENPLQGWIDQGQQLVARLTTELLSIDRKLSQLREQLSTMNNAYALVEGQRDQAEQAVLHALALVEGHPPTSPPTPTPPAEPAEPTTTPPPPSPNAHLERRRTGDGSRFAPAPGKVSQREWVLRQLVPGKHFRVAAIRDAFATEYGLTPDAATKNVSSILSYQLKGRDPAYPAIARIEGGVYQALPDQTGV